jgi:hypothetical protein
MRQRKAKSSKTSPELKLLEAVIQLGRESTKAAKALTPNDWCFIDKTKYTCDSRDKPYMLDYELARERVAVGGDPIRSR